MNSSQYNLIPMKRKGFTFTEIMFAVVILGIGFIMIAAVFPVAIKMNSQSAEETASVVAVERGLQTIRAGAKESQFPATAYKYPTNATYDPSTGVITNPSDFDLANTTDVKLGSRAAPFYHAPFVALGEAYRVSRSAGQYYATGNDATARTAAETIAWRQWVGLRGDLVSSSDPRIGFAVAYARAGDFYLLNGANPVRVASPSTIQMVVVVAQSRNSPTFNSDATSSDVEKRLRDLTVPFSNSSMRYQEVNGATWNNRFNNQFVGYTNAVGADHGTPATLQFKRLQARFYLGQNGALDRVRFYETSLDGGGNQIASGMTSGSNTCVAPGTFVIVADAGRGDPTEMKFAGDAVTNANARANGRVFRVGNEINHSGTVSYREFELVPGMDIASLPGTDNANTVGTGNNGKLIAPPYSTSTSVTDTTAEPVEVLVLGRALRDPSQPFDKDSNPYVGPAMDVAFYTMSVGLQP